MFLQCVAESMNTPKKYLFKYPPAPQNSMWILHVDRWMKFREPKSQFT